MNGRCLTGGNIDGIVYYTAAIVGMHPIGAWGRYRDVVDIGTIRPYIIAGTGSTYAEVDAGVIAYIGIVAQ